MRANRQTTQSFTVSLSASEAKVCRTRLHRILAALSICIAGALPLSACVKPANTSLEWPGPARGATVRVENRFLGEMHLYLLSRGTRYHLGVVSFLGEAIFNLPAVADAGSDVQFLAVPVAAGQPQQSELIAIRPGYLVGLTIQPGGNMSSLVLKR